MGKGKSVLSFILVLVIIAGLAYTAAFGVQVGDWLIPSVLDEEHGIRRGLDLVGGSVITFQAQTDVAMDSDTMARNMDTAVSMLRDRLNVLGYLEAEIRQMGTDRIVVEIPAISDPEEAIRKLGSTAQLEFINADGEIVITGSEISSATAVYGPIDNTGVSVHHVELDLTPAAVEKFAAATAKYYNQTGKNYISIVLDGEVKSAPSFAEPLNTARLVISGANDPEESKWLANVISAGQLPFTLKDIELRGVGPQLGEMALESCLMAAGIGLILVMLFMTAYYRLPGLLSSIILVGYVGIVAGIIGWLQLGNFKINLSLPGIAGIILSIGMAVDANVIIFERIKEELRSGKSIKASISAGFSRAFTAIIDANVTTLIAAAVLYFFGTGTIQGFAITLAIGIMVSMFTAIFLTRLMLNLAVGMNIKNTKAYGA